MRKLVVAIACVLILPPVISLVVRLAGGEVDPSTQRMLLVVALGTLTFFGLLALVVRAGSMRRRSYAKKLLDGSEGEAPIVEDVLLAFSKEDGSLSSDAPGTRHRALTRSQTRSATLVKRSGTVTVVQGLKKPKSICQYDVGDLEDVSTSSALSGIHVINRVDLTFSDAGELGQLSYTLLRGPFLQPQGEEALKRHVEEVWGRQLQTHQ